VNTERLLAAENFVNSPISLSPTNSSNVITIEDHVEDMLLDYEPHKRARFLEDKINEILEQTNRNLNINKTIHIPSNDWKNSLQHDYEEVSYFNVTNLY